MTLKSKDPGLAVRSDGTVALTARLPVELAAALQLAARRRGTSVSFLLAGLVRDFLAGDPEDPTRTEDR